MSLLPQRTQIDMVWVPGDTFAMGSDEHYPEEAPVHRVTVDGFWMDPTPVTNRQFREFVEATGYVTFAEVAPRAEDYPGALPHSSCARRSKDRSEHRYEDTAQAAGRLHAGG